MKTCPQCGTEHNNNPCPSCGFQRGQMVCPALRAFYNKSPLSVRACQACRDALSDKEEIPESKQLAVYVNGKEELNGYIRDGWRVVTIALVTPNSPATHMVVLERR
jgi:hypothetical protein